MKILVFSCWSIHEGITHGTIFPLLEKMDQNDKIDKVVLCTVESDDLIEKFPLTKKAEHIPIKTGGMTSLNKIWDLLRFPFLLQRIVKAHAVDLVWCKGAPAGGVGSLVHILCGASFVVDSCEPHSDYMLDSGTWSRFNPKFLIQRWLEQVSKKYALVLLPVSRQYCELLQGSGLKKERLFVFPCVVNVKQFKFKENLRKQKREQLKITDNCTVGIYVGKYGGLYYEEEAFQLYHHLFHNFAPDFFLIIITENDPMAIRSKLEKYRIPQGRVFISKAKHSFIAEYLCAADFAISTIRAVPAMRFCSPIKHGEYWAADLPILTTLPVGDDAEIIRNEGGGTIIDVQDQNPEKKLMQLKTSIVRRETGLYSKLASKYRHFSVMEEAIEFVLEKSVNKIKPID